MSRTVRIAFLYIFSRITWQDSDHLSVPDLEHGDHMIRRRKLLSQISLRFTLSCRVSVSHVPNARQNNWDNTILIKPVLSGSLSFLTLAALSNLGHLGFLPTY